MYQMIINKEIKWFNKLNINHRKFKVIGYSNVISSYQLFRRVYQEYCPVSSFSF